MGSGITVIVRGSGSGAGGTETTPLQWGLACVRSRAFQLTSTLFAQVPFCDLANHSERANAMVRPLSDSEAGQQSEPEGLDRELQDLENPGAQSPPQQGSQAAGGGLSVALVATEAIAEGSEVTISYTGVSGATNRRLMVQYGFSIPDNQHDRLDFELFEGYVGTTPLRGAPCGTTSSLQVALHAVLLYTRIGKLFIPKREVTGEIPKAQSCIA